MDKAKLLHKPRLEQAFKMFDKNGSGKVSFDELKQNLKGSQGFSDENFQDLIKEIDINGDGEMSYVEFEKMMTLLIKKNKR